MVKTYDKLISMLLQNRKSFKEIDLWILKGKTSNSNLNDILTPAQLACSISNIKTHTL